MEYTPEQEKFILDCAIAIKTMPPKKYEEEYTYFQAFSNAIEMLKEAQKNGLLQDK